MEAKVRDPPPTPASAAAAASAAIPGETPPEPPRRRGPSKRKAAPNSSSAAPPKRLSKERNALRVEAFHPLPTVLHNGPVTRARQIPNKLASSAAAAASASALQNPPPPIPPPEPSVPAAGDPVQAEEAKPVPAGESLVDAEFEAVLSRGSGVHAVPTPAGWFSWKTIHDVEKQTLPSFFNGKFENRTPEIYMDIRNSIMRKFHSDPQTPVEVKDLSEFSAGDLVARQEVLEFLDHWGLTNFHPFPPQNPDANMPDTDGTSRTASLIAKLYQFETVRSSPHPVDKKVELPTPAVRPLSLLPDSTIAGDLVTPVGPSVEYHCNSCSADCSRKRYHCQKQADFDLCTECYNTGKFGSGMAAVDFILMEPADLPGVSSGSWTDQETLLLLEALELFGENWSEIAEHVATKTKDQCILHFIQMPIEDPFLEGKDEDNDTIQEINDPTLANKESENSSVPETNKINSTGDMDETLSSPTDDSKRKVSAENEASCKTGASIALDILKAAFQAVGYFPEGVMSFSEAGNPVMALASFLTGLVEPGVAATSTRNSLKAMAEDSPGIQLATRHCFLLEDPPNDRKDPLEPESMDIKQPAREEDQVPVLSGTDDSKDYIDKNEKNGIQVEKEAEPSNSSQDFSQKPPAEIKLGEVTHRNTEDSGDQPLADEQTMPSVKNVSVSNEKDSKDLVLQGEDTSNTVKETNDVEMAVEEKPKLLEEFEDTSNAADMMLTSGPAKDTTSTTKETKDLEMTMEEKPNSLMELEDTSSAADMILTSAQAESQESQQTACTDSPAKHIEKEGDDDKKASTNDQNCNYDKQISPSDDQNCNEDKKASTNDEQNCNDKKIPPNVLEKNCDDVKKTSPVDVDKSGDDDKKASPNGVENGDDKKASPNDVEKNCDDDKKASPNDNDKNCNSMETNGDRDIYRLKRAAVTALSAAAVKAKLLANLEEDQIMQLVSLVIEKQLRKMEMKMEFFTDMETVILRVREQIDRARQRLLQERAQILAARFGVPASSQPASKVALGYGSTVLRPPSIASLNPPTRRQ